MADRLAKPNSHEQNSHLSHSPWYPDTPPSAIWDSSGIHHPNSLFSSKTWLITDYVVSLSDRNPYIQTPVVRKWKCCCWPAPHETILNPICSCGHTRCSWCPVVEYIQQFQQGLHDECAGVEISGLNITQHVPRPEMALHTANLDGASGNYGSNEPSYMSNRPLIARTLTLTHSAMTVSPHDPTSHPDSYSKRWVCCTCTDRRPMYDCKTVPACQRCQHFRCGACGVFEEIPGWDSCRFVGLTD